MLLDDVLKPTCGSLMLRWWTISKPTCTWNCLRKTRREDIDEVSYADRLRFLVKQQYLSNYMLGVDLRTTTEKPRVDLKMYY